MPGEEAGGGTAGIGMASYVRGIGNADSEALPTLAVTDVSPGVLEVMLRYMYMGTVGQLPRGFLSATGAATLFEAADRYLVLAMKVGNAWWSVGLKSILASHKSSECSLLLANLSGLGCCPGMRVEGILHSVLIRRVEGACNMLSMHLADAARTLKVVAWSPTKVLSVAITFDSVRPAGCPDTERLVLGKQQPYLDPHVM